MVMLNKFKQTQEQWGGSSEVIDHWLETRQSLIVEYCKLAALQPCSTKSALSSLPTPQELQVFCQHLVDYISEGHFKIYDMVMDKWRATGFEATDEINQAYGKIVLTTEPLLNFTDKYAAVSDEDTLDSFDSDMSLIGEIIEVRFEVEDKLIQMIADSLAVPPGA
ncbi:sigma D regulator [Vibrio sinaloensis]|uniref:sigma D regulator n=1 Tax=Vibrio TaxID=662 RepID=UPI0022AE7840|nr:sigma D regulator [Vibrio sinaloensis]MCZ4296276.1 sigma D regulator [Vibrio sinaloensis]